MLQRLFRSAVHSAVVCALGAIVTVVVGGFAQAVESNFDRHAAIAYSPSTGSYGYAYNHASRCEAERAALSYCTASDSRIVGWVCGGWVSLAIGENNGYGVD